MNKNNLLKNKWSWIIGGIILLVIIITIAGGGKEESESTAAQPQVSQEASIKNYRGGMGEPKLIGKWWGQAEVYLGRENGKYAASFEPALELTRENIGTFSKGLVDEVWGRNVLVQGVMSPIQYEERAGSTLVFYDTSDGGKIYFLVFKATDLGGRIIGMSFWKEQ